MKCGYRGIGNRAIATLGNAVAISERTLFCAQSLPRPYAKSIYCGGLLLLYLGTTTMKIKSVNDRWLKLLYYAVIL